MHSAIDTTELLRTKLQRPRLPTDTVFRQRLHARLSTSLDRALILITAPAGFGKSTLVSAWLENCDLPHAWVTVDEADNDLRVFLGYFAAAVQTINPDALPKTARFLASVNLPPLSRVARCLVNEFHEIGQDFILVLDDFHTIRHRAIHELLSHILQHPPPNMHLVISTRLEPPLPLAGYRARGAVLDLRGDDLLFSKPEIATLVEQSLGMPVTEDALSALTVETEGWAACIRLALQTLRSADDISKHLIELSVQNKYVIDYLMAEVLAEIPLGVRSFLLKTSILSRVCESLAQAVLGTDEPACDPPGCLVWLERANMFLVTLDPQGEWYQYHHLFQVLLKKESARHLTPEEIQGLHRRASAWYADQGMVEDALRHALAGQDARQAVQIVAQHRHHLLNLEQRGRLERWLRMFSSAETKNHPELLLAWAWCARLSRYDPRTVADLVDQAEARVKAVVDDAEYARQLRGEIDVQRCIEKGFSGNDPQGVVALASRALATMPQEWYLARTTARMHQAVAYQMSGQIDEAYAVIAAGRREQMADIDNQRVRSLVTGGFVSWMAADLAKVLQTGRDIIDAGQETNLQETIGWGHCFRAMVYYQRNQMEDAERCAKAVNEERHAREPISIAQSAFVLASIHQARNSYQEARAVLDSLSQYLREGNRNALLPMVRAFDAELAVKQGDLDLAGRWAATVSPATPFGIMAFFFAPHLTLPKVLLAMKTPTSRRQAAIALARQYTYVTETYNTRFTIEVLALQALIHQLEGVESKALPLLDRALHLAQAGGLIRVFVDLGADITPLLVRLQKRSASRLFIDRILKALAAEDATLKETPASRQAGLIESLSPREQEVLELLAQRLTDKEIAEQLFISPRTVNRHAANLYQKLQVRNRRDAVVTAQSLGII